MRPTPCCPPISFSAVRSATGSRNYAVHRDRRAGLEADRHLLRLVGRVLGRGREHEQIRGRCLTGILEHSALVRDVPDVAVARVDLLTRRVDRDVVLRGVRDRVLAAADVPLAPRRDHREVRRKRHVGELEANLVVALAGAAVRERIGADATRDFDLAARDERPGHRRAEQVLAVVDGAGAERRQDEILDELLAQVLDVALVGARGERLGANAFELVALADIGRDADDRAPP